MFLTNNVAKMLNYLDLSVEAYDCTFDTMEDYWLYAMSARYFSRKRIRPGVSRTLEEDGDNGAAKSVSKEVEQVEDEIVCPFDDGVKEDDATNGKPAGERRDGMDNLDGYLSTRKP